MTAPVLLPRQVAKLLHISPQKVTAMCRARVEGGRFNLTVDQERRMKRIRLSFPALTYEMMVEDSTIDA